SVHDRTTRVVGSNKVSALFALLPTQQSDPAAQLHTIAENNRLAKEHHYAIDADMLQDWAQFAAPAVFGLAVRAYSALRLAEKNRLAKEHYSACDADMLQDWAQFAAPAVFGLAVRAYSALRLAEKHRVVHSLLVSNVPGPPMPLYLFGARITGMYPLGPVLHGAGLNITVMSHDGRVSVGIIADREMVPDPWLLADCFPDAVADLGRAQHQGAVSTQRPGAG